MVQRKTQDVCLCIFIVATVATIYVTTQFLKAAVITENSAPTSVFGIEDSWLSRLTLNLLGYATIFVPGFVIYKYVKHSNYFDRAGSGYIPNLMRLCVTGPEPTLTGLDGVLPTHGPPRTTLQDAALMLFCFVGLQVTYLTWGILQEKVMTQEYVNEEGLKGHFKDSQFLVFVNRILAFILSGAYIMCTRQPRHTAPLYKYMYCSFSNIMSSWCQYEALKYVSFPTQVLSKASKIIPVMIMGKFLLRKKYEYYEYVTAVMISMGMTFFLMGSTSDMKGSAAQATTVSGLVLLSSYMLFDSFTSNWQGGLFAAHGMSSVQMMCGVNLFSCLFTTVSLAQQGGFVNSLLFMGQFPSFTLDCFLLSVCSAAGQLFIYFTIATFGPVVFVIIMTIRQCLAILLSCLIYEHHVSAIATVGVVVVFVAVFLRIYCNQRLKAFRKGASPLK